MDQGHITTLETVKSDLMKPKQGKLKKADPHYFWILCIGKVS